MDALGTAVSGLSASQLGLDVSADNVANADTPGHLAARVQRTAQPEGGVAASVAPGPGQTDLATESVAQVTESIAYAANARVVDVSTQLTKSLIDVLA